jgi:hypothetical protein
MQKSNYRSRNKNHYNETGISKASRHRLLKYKDQSLFNNVNCKCSHQMLILQS